jgi:hypothetical protein
MANQPMQAAPNQTSKPQRWEDLVATLRTELRKYKDDPRVTELVSRSPKDYLAECQNVRENLKQLVYWFEQLPGEEKT